ncbi:hypothetical protein FHS16_005440 [Paenibacillus endophyticus]|uniref:AAA domain-containing protein n=1 Tax=Paenibacillus endophyticus TaxID=1294268 RepID=A0A7W5CCZ5_9BACL|nr:AAA family ATPase [Paenibacillus endophyticus]MBB3155332.1 hypothetical protein [Paenibacillus endophyticus]
MTPNHAPCISKAHLKSREKIQAAAFNDAAAFFGLIRLLHRQRRVVYLPSLDMVKDRYDYILIDLPPNLGDQTINGLTGFVSTNKADEFASLKRSPSGNIEQKEEIIFPTNSPAHELVQISGKKKAATQLCSTIWSVRFPKNCCYFFNKTFKEAT